MNGIGSSFEHDDLKLIMETDGIDGIVIPKVSEISDLKTVIDSIGNRNFDLYPCIESAKGLMNSREILRDKRVKGVFFAAEDYCEDAVRPLIDHTRD